MRVPSRKGFGGPQPNSGRPAIGVRRRCVTATDAQWAVFLALGGSPWLQGLLNLLLTDRHGALVLLLIDELTKRHGREWLTGLVEKINERAKQRKRPSSCASQSRRTRC